MHHSTESVLRPCTGRGRLKALLSLVAAPAVLVAFTQWFACEVTPTNPTTGLDMAVAPDPNFGSLDVTPDGPVTITVGGSVLFTIRILDKAGDPMAGEEFLNVLVEEGLEIVRACGGNDRGPEPWDKPECAGLTPAHHWFDNDGIMWVEIRGVQEGTFHTTFAWPGCVSWTLDRPGKCPDDPSDPNNERLDPPAPWPASPFSGHYADEVVVEIVVDAAAPTDSDGDTIPDAQDNCPADKNTDQTDFDGDGFGDPCDIDDDGDGVFDTDDDCPATPPNTPVDAHGCTDTDEDGTPDTTDPCPTDPTDACAPPAGDADGDGVADAHDLCPGTSLGATVDGLGCPIPPSGPPTAGQIVSQVYDFFVDGTIQMACPSTNVSNGTAITEVRRPSAHFLLKVETTFGSGVVATTEDVYSPADGSYAAIGDDTTGNLIVLNGTWSFDVSGKIRFDGTLTEDFSSCQNIFDVSYLEN